MEEKNINISEETETVTLPDYGAEVLDMLRSALSPAVKLERILDYHERDIASALDIMTAAERAKLYALLDARTLSWVLEYSENRNEYISELSIRRKTDILTDFEPSVSAEYLESLEKEERRSLLELLPEKVKTEIGLLSSFDDDEIGSRMITNYIVVNSGMSVKGAMDGLIKQAADNDNISTIYVTDREGMFVGAISLKDLILARENVPLSSIVMTSYPYVYATEQIDECIERIKDYSEDSIPVLEAGGKLLGVILSSDVVTLVEDEMEDDYAKLAGLSEEDDLDEPLFKSIGKRLPWLVILLLLGLAVSSVVGIFEKVVASLAVIVSFQSLILGMAGNVGTQSLAVTVRVLADEVFDRKATLALVRKEAKIGIFNGFILGLLSFVTVGAYVMLVKSGGPAFAFSVSFCTGLALFISIILSSLTGTLVPIAFKRMKIDPAVASGPLITTVNDLVAVVSYYGLAWVFLIGVLGL